MATEFNPEDVIRQVTESLTKKFPDQDPTAIETRVRSEVRKLEERPIHDYISVLAERAVKAELKKA